MPEATDIVLFTNAGHLLSALSICKRIPGAKHPTHVYESVAGGWGGPIEWFGQPEQLIQLAAQCGWTFRFEDISKTKQVAIIELLSGEWIYQDPLRPRETARLPGALADAVPVTQNEVEGAALQYLLAAETEEQAQRILDALSLSLARGVQGTPVLLEPIGARSRFRFFWSVRWQSPDIQIFKSASRVWCGPFGFGDVNIYEQWPFTLAVPISCLHQIPWGPDVEIVLLSKDDPDVLLLRRGQEPTVLREIEEVARLTVGSAEVVAINVARPENPPRLEIEIRLVEESPRRAWANRITELSQEIEAKQAIRDQMLRRRESVEAIEVSPEPLFLIAETPDLRGEVPTELRRLLIEWADQTEDLRSLYYTKIESTGLPEGLFLRGCPIHVLTTATALGVRESGSIGVRLWEYAPPPPASRSMDLVPEWSRFGLRLFVPHLRRPEIYPHLRVGEVAAAKLAGAILPSEDPNPRHWLVLLLPGQSGRLEVLRLPTKSFTPLLDAHQWRCRLAPEVHEPTVAAAVHGRVEEELFRSLERSLSEAVLEQAMRRLNPIESESASLSEEVGEAQTAVAALAGLVAEASSQLDLAGSEVRNATRVLAEVSGDLHGVIDKENELRITIERLTRAVAELDRLRSALSESNASRT